jgi:hypothetical protein
MSTDPMDPTASIPHHDATVLMFVANLVCKDVLEGPSRGTKQREKRHRENEKPEKETKKENENQRKKENERTKVDYLCSSLDVCSSRTAP